MKRNAPSLLIHRPFTDFIEIQYKNIVQTKRQFRFVGLLIYNGAKFFIVILIFSALAATVQQVRLLRDYKPLLAHCVFPFSTQARVLISSDPVN